MSKLNIDSSPQEQFATANDITLCYDSFGDPSHPVMLLIMGLATQMIHWDNRFCQQLADEGYWVIRFDNRDIGKSSKIKGVKVPSKLSVLANQIFGKQLSVPYLLDDMAMDAFGLLDSLQIQQCHVVGVSMGGMIAQCMAIMAPERILSLTSIMSTTGNRSLPKAERAVMLKIMQPPPKEPQAYIQHALGLWKLLHGDVFKFEPERIEDLLIRARERSFYPAGIWRQTCAIIASPDRTAALGKLPMPSLVMHGAADKLVPVECGEATAAAIIHAKLKIYLGMGHTLPSELWASMIEEICLNAQTS